MTLPHHDLDPRDPERAVMADPMYVAALVKTQAALADGVRHPVRALYRVVPDELVFTRFHWAGRSGWPRPDRRSAVTAEQHADAGPDPYKRQRKRWAASRRKLLFFTPYLEERHDRGTQVRRHLCLHG